MVEEDPWAVDPSDEGEAKVEDIMFAVDEANTVLEELKTGAGVDEITETLEELVETTTGDVPGLDAMFVVVGAADEAEL